MRRSSAPQHRKERVNPGEPPLHCRDCPMWYGEENKGWGPCSLKHQRGAVQFITFGGHVCDEGYFPSVKIPLKGPPGPATPASK